MTTFAFPTITPNFSSWELVSNTAVFRALSNAVRTQRRDGDYWSARLTFNNLRADQAAEMRAFLAKLRGHTHRFTVHDHGQVQRGVFGGTPLVDGANQRGNSLNINGATINTTNWIRAGDHFGVNGELKIATADANSDASGDVTLSFTPPLRTAPADNAVITTASPTGVFVLNNNASGWDRRPGDLSNFIIVASEDVAA